MPLKRRQIQDDLIRFQRSERIYFETSAFNQLADVGIRALEELRAEQRSVGRIFVTSPMLLWEIMQIADPEQADFLMMAAQALFEPVLLGTPTELTIRYLRDAYPRNVVNYDSRSAISWSDLWMRMTRDYGIRFAFDRETLLAKSRPWRDISRNVSAVINGTPHENSMVNAAGQYVSQIHEALSEDLATLNSDEISAKLVILYTFLLLMTYADLEGAPAREFWRAKGFTGELEMQQVTQIFINYPEVFRRGPLLEMANMAALQYRSGRTNRGALHDGMHMVYSPHVDMILSTDAAFLELASRAPHYRAKIAHPSAVLSVGI